MRSIPVYPSFLFSLFTDLFDLAFYLQSFSTAVYHLTLYVVVVVVVNGGFQEVEHIQVQHCVLNYITQSKRVKKVMTKRDREEEREK